MNLKKGTIEVDGVEYPLTDVHFPTIDPDNPYELTAEERLCVRRLRNSFIASQKLWSHMRWMVGQGTMYLRREEHLIFHGCIAVDEQGNFLPMTIDGQSYTGRAQFKAIERVVYRVQETRKREDLDLLWYLWGGPRSPLFGKDRITTLERDLIADNRAHHETKNPYFRLIHEPWFCEKILAEFGVDPKDGLIVNGHVPVELEKGESPIKKSGKAITIDGAFSESLGDHGFTLVLEPHRTFLALHYHFESVEAAVVRGADIIPSITVVREWDRPKTVADSQRGRRLQADIKQLERLIVAYQTHELRERQDLREMQATGTNP